MGWIFLAAAILLEVAGTLAMRPGTHGSNGWFVITAVGYVGSTVFLAYTLKAGITVGVAYGIWAAVGVVLTALLGRALFGDPLTGVMAMGIALIAIGVFLLEFGSSH